MLANKKLSEYWGSDLAVSATSEQPITEQPLLLTHEYLYAPSHPAEEQKYCDSLLLCVEQSLKLKT